MWGGGGTEGSFVNIQVSFVERTKKDGIKKLCTAYVVTLSLSLARARSLSLSLTHASGYTSKNLGVQMEGGVGGQ